jgi:aspartyl-tRNA(Asn)/glutamyl-tRNA(Gln) amidotransferase subunit A
LDAVFLARASLDRIRAWDGLLNATRPLQEDLTLVKARSAGLQLRRGNAGPLAGIPVVIKDNINVAGCPMGCGSRILEGYRSPYSATVVERLEAAGAVPVAKANMDEFAMGSSGEYSAFGPTRNPWDFQRSPGGSSSGSIVSVAAGYAPLALGTDTGGSVRLPGSFCNVTALRPTYGVLSRYGVTSMASSLDQVGPAARSAEEVALALGVMAGRDPRDSTSVDLPGSNRLRRLRPAVLKGLKVGLPSEYFGDAIEPGVRTALAAALEQFREAGAELVEISLPHTRFAIETYYVICTSEVSSNLSRFDGLRYGLRVEGGDLHGMIANTRDAGFGAEVKRRILLGAFCLSKGYYDAFYLKALKARSLIQEDFVQAFRKVDLLATPVSPTVAFPLGDKTADPMAMYLADVYSVAPALASVPCLSLPAGFSQGLPVGLQLVAASLDDVRLLEVAHAFQLITGHHLKTPPMTTPEFRHGL